MKRTELRETGEFGLIEIIRKLVEVRLDESSIHDGLIRSIGDDTAVFRPSAGKVQLFTTDAMVEGIHFDLTFQSFKHLGWKALASNISDIAAMGGVPRYATIVLALPQKISVEMVEDFYRGAVSACRKYSCLIVGGDTTASSANMTVSVALTGEVDEQKVIYRNGARPGDLICVSGHVGGSHAGLKVLTREKQRFDSAADHEEFTPVLEPYSPVLQKYLMPEPRLDIARIFSEQIKVHAMIDVSDGVASEVHHICRSSRVGAEISEHNLPIDSVTKSVAEEFGSSASHYALFGGEDYELLFTISDEEFSKLDLLTNDVTIIGRILEAEKGIWYIRENGEREPLPATGWDHFGTSTSNPH